MLRLCAVAFQSVNKALGQETRIQTLGLYRSLLRSSEKYEHKQELKSVIRDRFKHNKHLTSRPKVLDLLSKADKTQQFLENGSTNSQSIMLVNAYIATTAAASKEQKRANTQQKERTKQKPAAAEALTTTAKKQVVRKPYQVAMTTQHSSGYEFKRVRGWRQPVKTAMMLKNRVKTNQIRLDRYYDLKTQLDMIRSEREFLRNLGCLPRDRLADYERNIKLALDENKKLYIRKDATIET